MNISRLTYDKSQFLLDGKPFRILSGTVHYFRVPRASWRDRLLKLRALGLNTVETYVCWNLHERQEGRFDFSGGLDLAAFLETARELGLYVILRPGPYICAEWDWGGLPAWLQNVPGMKLRCFDPLFLEKVRRYCEALFAQVRPFLGPNGNILMVQVENEYGSFGNDTRYLRAIADIYRDCGVDSLLFTSDGPTDWMLSGGSVPGILATVNFGSHPDEAFETLRKFRPDQPLFCCEFWCGWFDHWYEAHHVREDDAAAVYDRMLELGASVNIYVFHGGTNFGFTNGANFNEEYEPTVTSYDYDALLTESGDITPKYRAFQAVLEKHFGPAPAMEVQDSEKAAYGPVALTQAAPLFENLPALTAPVTAPMPLTMEEAGQDIGYILYRGTFCGPKGTLPLVLADVRDRAQVFLNGKPAGIVERSRRSDEISVTCNDGDRVQVDILVENMGRVNYGPHMAGECKGLPRGVRLGQQFQFGWQTCPLPLEDLSGLRYVPLDAGTDAAEGPVFLRGTLCISGEPKDTFLRTDGLTKGVVFVNGRNLGRYWCIPPTRTLYLPAAFLHPGENEIVVFESERANRLFLTLTDAAEL